MSRTGKIIRRTLALGLLVMVLVVVGLPAVLGWQLSKYHDRYVRQLAVPGLLQVQDVAFSRGILRSRSRVTLVPDASLCAQSPCPVITVDSVIHHGPIPFTAPPATPGALQIGLGVIVSEADISPLFPQAKFEPPLPPLELVTRVDFAGAADAQLLLPAERLRLTTEEDGGRINMERLQASLESPPGHSAGRGNLTWPSFKLVGDAGGQLGLQGLTSDFNGDAQAPLFWRRFGLKLNALQMVDSQGESFSLQGLLLDATNTAAPKGLLASDFQLRMSRLEASNREYGPVILEGEVKGLDVASLEAIQAAVTSLKPQALPPELLFLAISGIYQAHMPALLAADPELRITRLLVGTPDGDISADLQLNLADYSGTGPGTGTDLADVLKRLELQANVRLPAPIIRAMVRQNLQARQADKPPTPEAIAAAVEALTEAEFLLAKPEENTFVTQLRILNQNLTINGKVRDGWQETLDAFANGESPAVSEPQRALQ